MRYAIAIVVGFIGCSDAAERGGLEQVTDTRSGPQVDATRADAGPGDTVETADTTAEIDIGPVQCGGDDECAGRACNVGACVDGVCRFTPTSGDPCDDGNACTPDDVCRDGVCEGSGRLECLDADPCTDDRCSPLGGCLHEPKSCDDGNACTNDECREGVGCVATAIICTTTAACRVALCDPAIGCKDVNATDGTVCDDGRPCTVDACSNGACVGAVSGCNDGNPCTTDACVSDGCAFEPVIGCANDDGCLGRLAGASCDDGDDATTADLCIGGSCRGFRLTRIPGAALQGQQTLVVTEIDQGPEGWSAIVGSIDVLQQVSYSVVGLDNPASPVVHGTTTQSQRIAVLRAGFAGDAAGHIWQHTAGGWTQNNAWDAALGTSGRGAINALFTLQGGGGRSMWVVGGDDGEWLRLCKQLGDNTVCSAQILDNDNGASVPQVIDGVPACDDGSCTGATLAMGADAALGGGLNYTDTYENETGVAATWAPGYVPETPANRATRGIAGWRDTSGVRFLVVGDNGYLVLRRADGTWRGPLALHESQTTRDFSGVWVGAGLLMATAQRVGSQNSLIYELWTVPLTSNLESGNSWLVHELGRFPQSNEAGLRDIASGRSGELRVVGAVGRAQDLFGLIDGAVWVRTP